VLTQSGLSRAVHAALALGVALAATMAFAVQTAEAASGPADAQASEMVRLINGVRWANNLPALNVDPKLAGLARDTRIACPADASLVMLGRAKDFATYGPPSHYLRLCPTVMFVSTLQSYGYGTTGEIDLDNLNYGTGARLLSYTGSKRAWQTWTYYTNQAGILGWMNSPTHRAIVVGGYDRVGCGGWIGADGAFFYDCLFGSGGPGSTVAPPTQAPFNIPLPTAQPTPRPTPRPTPVVTAPPKPAPTGAPTKSEAPLDPTPVATPTIAAAATPASSPTVSPTPSPRQSATSPAGKSAGPGTGASTSEPLIASSIVGVATGALAGLLAASYGLLVTLRRRGRRRPGAS
jgi:uncharacterized protein YkwD